MSGEPDGAKIVLHAEPFCYGPASIAIALGAALRELWDGPITLTAIAAGTAFELVSGSRVFDGVVEIGPGELSDECVSTAMEADTVLTVAGFGFAFALHAIGIETVLVDPLFWMWHETPSEVSICSRYYVLDFPGVSERVADCGESTIRVVPQIAHVPRLERSDRSTSTTVVHFGGVHTPYGDNRDLVAAIVLDLIDVVTEAMTGERVLVRCGKEACKHVADSIGQLPPWLDVDTKPQDEFHQELAECSLLLTAPGMSIVYEAAALRCRTAFLLPLNYSQHRQQTIYSRLFPAVPYISWDHLDGFSTLPSGILEEPAVHEAISIGKRYVSNLRARAEFRDWLRRVLGSEVPPLELPSGKLSADGATHIARDLLSAYRSSSAIR